MQNTHNTHNLDNIQIKEYWKLIFTQDKLNNDETARIVFQANVKSEFKGRYENLKDFQITDNVQLKTAEELTTYMTAKISENPHHDCGISISSGIFNYDPNNLNEKGNVKAPSINTFKKLYTVVFDIDAHIKNSKERFHIYMLDPKYIQIVIMRSYLEIVKLLKDFNINSVVPIFSMISGGGIQIAFQFSEELFTEDAKLIFGRLGEILGGKKFDILIKDMLGNFSPITMEIDNTFKDISHTQRLAGVKNNKYNYMASFNTVRTDGIFNFFNQEILKDYLKKIISEIDEEILETSYTDEQKRTYEKYYVDIIKSFQRVSKTTNDLVFSKNELLEDARISRAQSKNSMNVLNTTPLEYELVQNLKELLNQSKITLEKIFPGITFENHGSYWKILCPFHEESKPSMAVYQNSLKFEDFHDNESYTIIDVFMKLNEVSKGDAINKIADIAGIKFKKSDRKDFEKMEMNELIDVLIEKIDVDTFVYYRLANKNRACIIRHIDSGETFSFDGMHLLANHVLMNQLNINDIDYEFQKEFAKKFEQKIIIEAFEEFQPGKDVVFQRNFIKFVNLWVPSKHYETAHKTAKELEEEFTEKLAIEDSIIMIREKAPWTFKYILQLVQKGDLNWFINWLVATANHYVLPTIPVFFGVPGAGKNLFVSTILEWYVNSEFTKILSTERLMSNFNSILEACSLLVLDEGDFSTQKSNDALKLITGSDKMLIEKKGVDTQSKNKQLNIIMFSNGQVPARHPSADRRMVYFNSEITLLELTTSLDITIDKFVENVKEELETFWSIILNTKLNKPKAMTNLKNATFWRQILKMHPAGELILQMLNEEWKEIGLQLNENVADPVMMKNNLELLDQIRKQFESNSGSISLTLINRYLQSLNYKVTTSVQRFLANNNLEFFGVTIEILNGEVLLLINKEKLRKSLKIDNLVLTNVPEVAKKIKRIQTKIKKMNPQEVLSSGDEKLAEEEIEYAENSEKTIITNTTSIQNVPKLKEF